MDPTMNLVRKLLSRNRVRKARQRLSAAPSPMTYASLAREHAIQGGVREALRICEEGLAAFPGSRELVTLADRIRQRQRERRMRDLKRVLREAPRPAVWQETCEILLESGQVGRAEECCLDWQDATRDAEATLMLARVRVERFLSDRNRDEGQTAFQTLDSAQYELARDPRLWELRLRLASRIGAWAEAHRAAGKLLELEPGNPGLEGRFRTLESMAAGAPDVDAALREVERTGLLHEERLTEADRQTALARDVRPTLKRLAATEGVEAALYVRGGTALVQGPRGATAERAARAVRSIVQSGRTASRRLGLGHVSEMVITSSKGGTLTVAAGELDAGAAWTRSELPLEHRRILFDLAGVDAAIASTIGEEQREEAA